MEPLIGITSYVLPRKELATRPWIRGVPGHEAQYVAVTYPRALWTAGGLPWLLPVEEDRQRLRRLVQRLDGLILAGGEDLTPGFLDAPSPPRPTRTVERRDRWEHALWEEACRAEVPILGICRGLQAVNQFAGGSLLADIPACRPASRLLHRGHGIPGTRPAHEILLEPGTMLRRLGRRSCWKVNSFHHQAVDEPAPGLRVAARAPDGIVEALEGVLGGPFLGVQWHPEAMQDGRLSHWIHPFRWIVQQALIYRADRGSRGSVPTRPSSAR